MDKRLPKEITENKWIRLALRLIPFVPFLSVLWVKTSLDNDTYWIIKTGEYIFIAYTSSVLYMSVEILPDLINLSPSRIPITMLVFPTSSARSTVPPLFLKSILYININNKKRQ